MKARPYTNVPLLALGGLALLAGLWAGLLRLGWQLPVLRTALVAAHGPLMISGFLGTLINLERAVALSAALKTSLPVRWTYAAPLLTGLGSVAIIVGLPVTIGAALITLGSLGLVVAFGLILRRHPALYTATLGLGALAWLVGNALWLGGRLLPQLLPWLVGFLILTIVGERLELSRLLRLSRGSQAAYVAASGLFLAGLILSVVAYDVGMRLTGAGMVALTVWLLRYDIARRTIRQTGLPRFVAVCLLSGYVWLAVAGTLWVVWGGRYAAGPVYDAMLHSVLLGFVFSMIFGHAPIILPALLPVELRHRPGFYTHFGLLHAGLLVRVVGDLAALSLLRKWGGLLNVFAIVLFLANMVFAVIKSDTRATQ